MSEIGDALNDAMGGLDILGIVQVTFRRTVPGSRGTDVTTGSHPTVTDYPCNAFKEDKRQRVISELGDTLIRIVKPVISIFGSSLPEGVKPKAGDIVIWTDGTEYTIEDDASDPVDGLFVCNCKGS